MILYKLEMTMFFKDGDAEDNIYYFLKEPTFDLINSYITKDAVDVNYRIIEVDFEETKKDMTISQYESLFQTNLKPNYVLNIEDLHEGTYVWNETQEEYQRVRYISTRDRKDYHWVDGWGNDIEDDKLYTYKLR